MVIYVTDIFKLALFKKLVLGRYFVLNSLKQSSWLDWEQYHGIRGASSQAIDALQRAEFRGNRVLFHEGCGVCQVLGG